MSALRVSLRVGLLAIGFIAALHAASPASGTGALTLPIVGFGVGSWFDHTSPASSGAGLVATGLFLWTALDYSLLTTPWLLGLEGHSI